MPMMPPQGMPMPPEMMGQGGPPMGGPGMEPPPPEGMMSPQMPPQAPPPDEGDIMEDYLNQARENANLAKGLRKKKQELLDELADKVVDGYNRDENSRDGWMKANKKWMELALLKTRGKTFPWPNASDVKYPLLSTAAMQFSARAYPALVPADGRVVKSKVLPFDPTGELLKKGSDQAKHMSYQVLYKTPDWEENMDKLLMAMAISGLCFKETYYDDEKKCIVSDLVYPEDLCINYHATSLQSAYRITRIHRNYTLNDIKAKVNNDEMFLDIDYGLPAANKPNEDKEARAVDDSSSDVDSATPYTFLEQHTYHDIDGDGYEEPYIITVHLETKKVVRIIARWDEKGVTRGEKNKVIKIDPVEYYTDFPFIPNPDGSIYALGFGVLLGPLNVSVNTLINQITDSGTLSNLPSGFISKGLRIKMGDSLVRPGEWKAVNATMDDLQKGFFPLPTKDPSPVLMNLLQMLTTAGNQLASIAEIMVGKMPGQNTPATTTQETVKQGMAVFTAIYKRVYRSLDKEFKKFYRLNGLYKDMVDEEAAQLGLELTNTNYSDDSLIIPGGDPTGDSESTKQGKIAAVGNLLQFGTIDPMAFTKWNLEVAEVPNPEALIKKDQGPPPPSPEEKKIQLEMQLMQQKGQQESTARNEELQFKREMNRLALDAKRQELGLKSADTKLKAHATMQTTQLKTAASHIDTMNKQRQGDQKLQQNDQQFRQKMQQQKAMAAQKPKEK